MHSLMSVPLESTKSDFTDSFNKLSRVPNLLPIRKRHIRKGIGAVRTSTMIAVKSDNKVADRKSIKSPHKSSRSTRTELFNQGKQTYKFL